MTTVFSPWTPAQKPLAKKTNLIGTPALLRFLEFSTRIVFLRKFTWHALPFERQNLGAAYGQVELLFSMIRSHRYAAYNLNYEVGLALFPCINILLPLRVPLLDSNTGFPTVEGPCSKNQCSTKHHLLAHFISKQPNTEDEAD